MPPSLRIQNLGRSDYETTWRAMQAYTAQRNAASADQLWLTEHDAIYTLGLNRKHARPPARSDIPLLAVDRGGKITYHGPGQVVIYLLIDLQRKGWNVRQLVNIMENAVIGLLAAHGVHAEAHAHAPGVYVDGAKIASLGLRLKNGCCYHGLALNVDMDLAPFSAIDPCGYKGLKVTQLRAFGIDMDMTATGQALAQQLAQQLNCATASLEIPA